MERSESSIICACFGELTAATLHIFERTIRTAVQASPQEIVIDLDGVDLIDEHGRTALLKAHLRPKQRGPLIKFVPEDHEVVTKLIELLMNGGGSE